MAPAHATASARTQVVGFAGVRYAYPQRGTDGVAGRVAVDGLDVAIGRGEVLALVGRSGSGKSTLLKLINRMLMPQAGSVFVEGRDTRDWNPIALRRRTGYEL